MIMEGQGQLRAAADQAQSSAASPRCEFQWVERGAAEQLAQLSGLLRWRGFDIEFAVDGLLGVDGRLDAPSLAMLSADLRQLVLRHFADELLQALQAGPLAELTLFSLQWHDEPLAMRGEFEFLLRREGLRGFSRGRLGILDQEGRAQWVNALGAHGWAVPPSLSTVPGHLHLGLARLLPEELAGLEVGDLVWVEEAEISPTGLRARFVPHEAHAGAYLVSIKRSDMARTEPAPARLAAQGAPVTDGPSDGLVTLSVTSPEVRVQRSWLQGAVQRQSLPQPVLSLPWQMGVTGCAPSHGGQLVVVARRLGLRLTCVPSA